MFRHHVPVDPVTGVSPCFAEHDQHDCGDAQGNRDCDHHWFFNVLASTKAALCTGEWPPNHFDGLYLCEPVDLLSREAISEMIGSDRFHGGLVYQRAGTLNPTGSCRVLARAARGAGAEINTGVRARKLRHHGGVWKVKTDQGTVMAKAVGLGTNAYADDLWPVLSQIFSLLHYFQLATKPFGPEAANILPRKLGNWDTG
jgi:glycine/D-amino acid oxidase-like deaminating enzyme